MRKRLSVFEACSVKLIGRVECGEKGVVVAFKLIDWLARGLVWWLP